MGIPLIGERIRAMNQASVPQRTPMEIVGQAEGLRGMIEQREALKREEQRREEAMRQQQRDQQAVREILSDPSIDWANPQVAMQTVMKKSQGRISPETMTKIGESLSKSAKDFLSLDEAKRKRQLEQNDVLYQAATAITKQPSPEAQAALYAQSRAQLIQQGLIPPDAMPEQYDPQWVAFNRGGIGLSSAVSKLALEEAERASKEKEAAAKATMAEQEAKLTPEERANLKSRAESAGSEFERAFFRQYGRMPDAKELASFRISTRTEPGSYIVITDERGTVKGAWNPKSGKVETTPEVMEGGRKSGLSETALLQRSTLTEMETELGMLEELANRNRDAIGPADAAVGWLASKTVGNKPEVAELRRLAKNLADNLLRARSGAQISQPEYERLVELVPQASDPESNFFTKLKSFKGELQRVIKERTGKSSASPSGGEAPPSNLLKEGVVTTFKNGQAWTLSGGEAKRVK